MTNRVLRSVVLLGSLVAIATGAASCGNEDPNATIRFPAAGPAGGDAGRGSWTFGAATAAAQIEENNQNADWWVFTQPVDQGGLGIGEFVDEAVQGYTRAVDDMALVDEMNLDAYRFSVNWARMEPTRDNYDESAFQAYSDQLDEMVRRGIKPMVTVHHFSSPIWLDDPRINVCDTPSDTNLCGWGHPTGGQMAIDEIAEFAGELARRYGDRVDEWVTLNEPVNYLVASYLVQVFPPGRNILLTGDFNEFIDIIRNFIAAHAAIYDAILANDTVDADGDGQAATIGLTLNTIEWVGAQRGMVSENEASLRAGEALNYLYNNLFIDSILDGTFDPNFDQSPEETHPDWEGKLDFLGVQNYSRQGVTGSPGLLPVVMVTPCFDTFDFGSCIPPLNDDETHCIPDMGYEWAEESIYKILVSFSERWPDLPMTITESGIATNHDPRRREHIVRSLEQIWRARREGADVRGYYHWSLVDNFEWAEGYIPRFGLYRVDTSGGTYARSATGGSMLLGEIAGDRRLTREMRLDMGGIGPMTPEPGAPAYRLGCRPEEHTP